MDLIGRRFSDSSVQSDIKLWPFKVIPGPADKPMIVVQDKGEEKQFAAEEIFSMVLMKMREIAEAYLGSIVKFLLWLEGNSSYDVNCETVLYSGRVYRRDCCYSSEAYKSLWFHSAIFYGLKQYFSCYFSSEPSRFVRAAESICASRICASVKQVVVSSFMLWPESISFCGDLFIHISVSLFKYDKILVCMNRTCRRKFRGRGVVGAVIAANENADERAKCYRDSCKLCRCHHVVAYRLYSQRTIFKWILCDK
ncbi:hypothetical protein Droror1_Dr00027443 [Drosera rotundifolia]